MTFESVDPAERNDADARRVASFVFFFRLCSSLIGPLSQN